METFIVFLILVFAVELGVLSKEKMWKFWNRIWNKIWSEEIKCEICDNE